MRMEELRELFYALIQVMAKAIDERTPYNAAHTRNMVRYGKSFIAYLNKQSIEKGNGILYTKIQEEEILISIWLHDIGKLITPLGVMNKASRLTVQAKETIKHRFTVIGLLAKMQFLKKEIRKQEEEAVLKKLEEAWQEICRADAIDCLTEELLQKIKQIEKLTYTDERGLKQNWLTPAETESLSIPRGTLTEREREIMEEHVVLTAKLLGEIDFRGEYKQVPKWAAGHHELLDGSGYPNHLSGEEIPKEVRIISILDIFDALTADDRPYKPGMSIKEALKVLAEMAKEGKLDTGLVQAFKESRCWE